MRWYTLSAEQGFSDAQYNLRLMCEEGHGTAQSLVRAHVWWNLSAAQGYKKSQKLREEVSKKMKQQQIAEAQELASECKARNHKARNHKGCD